VRHFDQGDVFAVSAASLDWEGIEALAVRQNDPSARMVPLGVQHETPGTSHTLFASGGFSAIERRSSWSLAGSIAFSIPPIAKISTLVFARGAEAGGWSLNRQAWSFTARTVRGARRPTRSFLHSTSAANCFSPGCRFPRLWICGRHAMCAWSFLQLAARTRLVPSRLV